MVYKLEDSILETTSNCREPILVASSQSYIPIGKTLRWPHLKHLAHKLPSLQNCEVGLLIGYDFPSALAPLEVVTGGRIEPFAQ